MRNYSFQSQGAPFNWALPNERKERFSDAEAFEIINHRIVSSDSGRDTTHLRFQREWYRNIRYFIGLQNSPVGAEAIDDFDLTMLDEPGAHRFVANFISRIVTAQVSRMSQAKPDASVIPKSPDIEDQEGARVGQFFLDHWDDTFNYRTMRREAAFWSVTCGTAFLFSDWNAKAGETLESFSNPYDQSPITDIQSDDHKNFLRSMGGVKTSKAGTMEAEVKSPFQIQTPINFTRHEDMPWMLIEDERSLDWVWDNYPKIAPHIRPDDIDFGFHNQFLKRVHTLVSGSGWTHDRGGVDSEAVTVRTLWIPPSTRFPNGAKIVATRTLLLENGPHPLAAAGLDLTRNKFLRFPVTRVRYTPVPGRYWGMGLVEHLIDAQRDYNTTREQLQAIRDILSHPQWLAPEGAKLKSTRADYGDIWTYSGTMRGKPELQSPPALSQYHTDLQERAVYDMQMISAQSDASQAQVPDGVRSGVALRALQEQDMMVLGPTIEEMEDGWRETMQRMLALTWKFLRNPIAVRIYGDARMADVQIFKGEDLNGNMQVRIRPGSMTPKSQAATQQTMMDMVQFGMLNPADPAQNEIMFRAMDIGGTEELHFQRSLDRRRANIENYMFMRPDPTGAAPFPDVDDDDDHAEHIDEHLRFKKTDTYEKLPLARKLAFDAHLMKHRRAQAALVQTQLMLMGGGPGGGGGGGSPPAEKGQPSEPAKKQPTPGTSENK